MKVYYPSKTTGSAKKLEGSINVISFFVSETPWPLNEKMVPHTELEISPLTAWLVGLSEKEESWFETFLPK